MNPCLSFQRAFALFICIVCVGCARSVEPLRAVDVPDAQVVPDTLDVTDAPERCNGLICDGLCVDVQSNPLHCGQCRIACPTPDFATPICSMGTCDFRCDPGYERMGNACVWIPAPRPIHPASVSRVHTHQPHFEWTLPQGFDTAVLELCTMRDCESVAHTYTVRGTRFTTPSGLETGVWYWRLRAVRGMEQSRNSVTWEFFTPRVDSPSYSESFPSLDMNGDGFVDVAVSNSVHVPRINESQIVGVFSVLPGSAAGVVSAEERVPAVYNLSVIGGSPLSLGDVNGDGYSDVLSVGASEAYANVGELFLGSVSGVHPVARNRVRVPADSYRLMSFFAPGDVNGDGHADLLANFVHRIDNRWHAYGVVYFGSPSGFSQDFVIVAPQLLDVSDYEVTPAGDVNGDGFLDVLVSRWLPLRDVGMRTAEVSVHLGSRAGVSATPQVTLVTGVGNDRFGAASRGVGDVNGDGFGDVLVSATNVPDGEYDGEIRLFLGSAQGLQPRVVWSYRGPRLSYSGSVIGAVGDLNADGYDDFASNSERDRNYGSVQYGALRVFAGGPTTPQASPTREFFAFDFPLYPDQRCCVCMSGFASVSGGDVNGDGFSDLVTGGELFSGCSGMAFVYHGGPTNLGERPTQSLVWGDAWSRFGRTVSN